MDYLNIKEGIDYQGANPAARAALEAAGKAFYQKYGRPMRVVSANRSYEQQAALYKQKGAGWAAKPGTSNHERGSAFDIASGDAGLADEAGILSQYGLRRPLLNTKKPEPWHVEYKGGVAQSQSLPQMAAMAAQVQQPQQVVQPQVQEPIFQDYYGQMNDQQVAVQMPTTTLPTFLKNDLSNPLSMNLFNRL